MTSTAPRLIFVLLSALTAGGLGGCAAGALSQGDEAYSTTSITTAAGPSQAAAPANSDDAEVDCKRLAGKVQLRLLEVRNGMSPEESSLVSRSIQSAGAVVGGSTQSLNTSSSLTRELAELQTANNQLVQRNCRSFNIAKALTGEEIVPAASVPPKKQVR